MRYERTKNAIRNIVFGFLGKIVGVICPFIVRTVMIYIMGSEYVGLSSLFSSILGFLSFAELGIGSALVFYMYKPIAEEDDDTVCAILNLYRRLYRYIGLIIMVIGVSLIPFLHLLVKGECPPDVNLYVLYGIYLFNSVISYWMFAYKQSILIAHQRVDVTSKWGIVLSTVMYLIQIVMILVFRNYYFYIIWTPVFTVITNLVCARIVDRMYPQYQCRGEIDKETKVSIRKKVVALVGTQANSIVMSSADSIVISAFLGLTMVGLYGNYYLIMNTIAGFMTMIYSSIRAGLGNGLEVNDLEKNYSEFRVLTFLNTWLSSCCTVCFLCMCQNFMRLWVHESRMLDMGVVVLLAIYFYVYQIRRIVLTYKDAKGVWWEDRFRPYVMMVVNLVGNLIMVNFIGLYGVILSTIIAMIVSMPWENHTAFKYIFCRSGREYYKAILGYAIVTVVSCVICYVLCCRIPDTWWGFLLRGVICMAVSNGIIYLIYRKTYEFQMFKEKARAYLKNVRSK